MDAAYAPANRSPSTASTMCGGPQSWKWIRHARQPDGNGWIRLPITWKKIRRDVVMEAIWEVHARSNHLHTVLDGEVPPVRVMSDFKAYASRRLNLIRLNEPGQKRWAHHGSTRWLWKPRHVSAASRVMRRPCVRITNLNFNGVPCSASPRKARPPSACNRRI